MSVLINNINFEVQYLQIIDQIAKNSHRHFVNIYWNLLSFSRLVYWHWVASLSNKNKYRTKLDYFFLLRKEPINICKRVIREMTVII